MRSNNEKKIFLIHLVLKKETFDLLRFVLSKFV